MYSPKISEKYIPALYRLGKALKLPMTKLVDNAVKNLLRDYGVKYEIKKVEQDLKGKVIHYSFEMKLQNKELVEKED
jgi:hypothetical protein